MLRFAFPLVLLFVLIGCGGSRTGADDLLLTGTSWTVERIVYPDGSIVRGSGETLAFGSDGSLSMSSCNSCQGRFQFRRGLLIVDERLACTRRACFDGAVELERVVNGEQNVSRDGSYLVLSPVAEGETVQVLLLPSEAPASAE